MLELRWCQIGTTVFCVVCGRLEPGGLLAAGGVFGEQGLEFAVEGCGFELGERLVQDVLVLFGEELPESVVSRARK